MANVLFKRGPQSHLPQAGQAQDGVFYLTNDTNRLYVGNSSNNPVLLNQTVQIVDSISDLTAKTTAWGANASQHINDFYYVSGSNILAIYTDSGDDSGWVQINPDHNTTNSSASLQGSASNDVGTITVGVTDSEGDSVSGSMTITGAGSVHITDDSNHNLVVTGETYTLSKAISGTDDEVATITLNSSVAANSTSLRIVSSNPEVLSFESTSTGFNIIANDTSLSGGSATVTANAGTLSVSVSDSEGNTASGSASQVGVVLNDGSYAPLTSSASGTSTGALYSKNEIDTMMKGLDGMTYKGTIGTSGATISALPSSNVKNGDTYVIVESGLTASSTPFTNATFEANTATEMSSGTKIGDMVIAKGTEGSDGNISGTITWTYIPAGNDSLDDVTYTATVDTSANSIKLANANGTGIAKMALVAGTDMAISSAVSTDTGANSNSTLTSTINHATISTTATTGSAITGAASYTAITNLTVNNGHITGYTTQEYSPVTYDLEGAAVSMDSEFSLQTNSGTNVASVETRLVDSEGNYSTNDSVLKIESSSIKMSAGTGANANKVIMNFEWGSF